MVSVRTHPVKILVYSAELSVLALCFPMALGSLSLPQAYLELQVVKRHSFFVYQSDLGLLRKVGSKLNQDRGRSKLNNSTVSNSRPSSSSSVSPGTGISRVQRVNGVEGGTEVGWNPGLHG